jgi:hypothetical protein
MYEHGKNKKEERTNNDSATARLDRKVCAEDYAQGQGIEW